MSFSQHASYCISHLTRASKPLIQRSRSFHSTAINRARRRPRFPSIKAADLGLIDEKATKEHPEYSNQDEELLSKKYSPAQVAAIKAAEASISPQDVYLQRRPRQDPWRMTYKDDDLAEIDASLDKAPKGAIHRNHRQKIRPKNEEELDMSLAKFFAEVGASAQEYGDSAGEHSKMEEGIERRLAHFMTDSRSLFYAPNEEAYQALDDSSYDVMRKPLPKINDPATKDAIKPDDDTDVYLKNLALKMGWTTSQVRNLFTKTLYTSRVVNQTRMGKISSMFFICIAGNRDGLLGVGIGKSVEPEEASRQARHRAIRNMKPIKRYENRTLFGEVEGKSGAVRVKLKAMGPGFGNRAQHLIFEMTRAAGIADLSARVGKSRNKMNVIKATWAALLSQKSPEDIARARGMKLIDLRKVYYGGMTQ